MRLLALLFLALPIGAAAQYQYYLESDKPNELGVSAIVDEECPFTEAEVRELAEGVLIRSRLKPVHFIESDPSLSINLLCMQEGNMFTWEYDVRFTGYALVDDLPTVVYFLGDYGGLGRNRKSSMQTMIKDAVERAVTEYLKVNFDLGD